jgi:hypothetical protein
MEAAHKPMKQPMIADDEWRQPMKPMTNGKSQIKICQKNIFPSKYFSSRAEFYGNNTFQLMPETWSQPMKPMTDYEQPMTIYIYHGLPWNFDNFF